MSPSAALIVLLCLAITAANAINCPNLLSAANFAAFAYTGMTNGGKSVVTGIIGVCALSPVTGFPPGSVTGGIEVATTATKQAQIDETSAYTYCKGLTYTKILSGTNLAGQTLAPGVYHFASTAAISAGGNLTLNGTGVYIFQVGSAITTGAGSRIVLKNGAKAGCIFWQVGSSVTHGASSTFIGNILAYASVTFGAGVAYEGSVYAQTGDITLSNDTITQQPSCIC